MSDVERGLIWKTISTGELTSIVTRGIEPDHFIDEECRDVYDFMLDFMRKHKSPPSASVVKEEFPKFKALISKDPVSYHVERFIKKAKEREAIDLVRGFHEMIEDPDEIDDIDVHALEMARRLAEVIPAPRATLYSEVERRIEEYNRRLESGEVHGTYLGIPTLDLEMQGIQPHEMLVIVAYMGIGKSTMMQHMAYSAYLQGKTSLYVSLEMEAEALLRKLDVMATNVKYHAMKALELGIGDIEKWKKIAEEAHKDRHERDIIIRDDIRNCTADKVLADVMRYKPDLVFVDYLELMSRYRGAGSSSAWESISDNGVALKQNARVMRIPHISAAQLNREGGKGDVNLANVSFQSIGKHSDLMIGLAQDEEMEAAKEMRVLLLKNRDGKKVNTSMRWNLEQMEIHEKGHAERFPERGTRRSMISSERRKQTRLGVKRTIGGRDNPFSARAGARKRNHGPKGSVTIKRKKMAV